MVACFSKVKNVWLFSHYCGTWLSWEMGLQQSFSTPCGTSNNQKHLHMFWNEAQREEKHSASVSLQSLNPRVALFFPRFRRSCCCCWGSEEKLKMSWLFNPSEKRTEEAAVAFHCSCLFLHVSHCTASVALLSVAAVCLAQPAQPTKTQFNVDPLWP